MSSDDTRSLARGGAFSLVGSVTSAVAGLLLILVLGRTYGAAGAGVVLQVVAAFSIALGIARGGLDTTAVWLLPRLSSENAALIRPALVRILAWSFGLGVVGGLALAIFGRSAYGDHAVLGPAFLAAAVFLPAASVMTVGLASTRGLGGVRPYVLISNILVPGIRPLLVLVAALGGLGTLGGVLAWLAPFPVAAGVTMAVLIRGMRRRERHRSGAADPAGLGRRILRYSWARALAAVLEQAMLWVDVLLVGLLAGPAAAGIYGAATRFVNAGRIVSTALRIVVAPTYSRLLGERQSLRVQRLYTMTTQWVVLFSVPFYLVLAAFGGTMLGILGHEFRAGALALAVLTVGVVVSTVGGNLQALLLMSGHSGWAAVDKAVTLVVLAGGIWILTPLAGIEGAATAWTVAMIVDVALGAYQVHRLVGVRVGGRGVALALGVAGIAPAGPVVAARLLLGDSLHGMAVGAVGGALCWLALALLLRKWLSLADVTALAARRAGD